MNASLPMLLLRLLSALLRALLVAAVHTLSPRACACCDAPVSTATVFCAACARTLAHLSPAGAEGAPFRAAAQAAGGTAELRVIAFASFAGALADAVRRFKYGDRPDLARPLGHLLRCAVRDAGLHADLVVPVPLHPRRLAERGYNQAALLAAHAAREIGAPLAARALLRLRDTAQQAHLTRALRIENVAGGFCVREPRRVRGRAVLLIDDVVTTGATLQACSEALVAAGAASVTCLVVACADKASGVAVKIPPRSASHT
jgi:ComF family protein